MKTGGITTEIHNMYYFEEKTSIYVSIWLRSFFFYLIHFLFQLVRNKEMLLSLLFINLASDLLQVTSVIFVKVHRPNLHTFELLVSGPPVLS